MADEKLPSCEDCEFFTFDSNTLGTCQRYAPRPVERRMGKDTSDLEVDWPWVKTGDFCGEWKQAGSINWYGI